MAASVAPAAAVSASLSRPEEEAKHQVAKPLSEQQLRELLLKSGLKFLTPGGIETCLLFEFKWPLREFAAFEVVKDERALARLEDELFFPILQAASEKHYGVFAELMTWRASPSYMAKMGYAESDIEAIHRQAASFARASVQRMLARLPQDAFKPPVIITADVGPCGDGYFVSKDTKKTTAEEFRQYHSKQLRAAKAAGVDMAAAWTCTTPEEAIGIALAAKDVGLLVTTSCTLETDGRLPDGTPLPTFIELVDKATDNYPLFYIANCVHTTHIAPVLEAAVRDKAPWLQRFKGLRANASAKSHAELDNSTELDAGNQVELAQQVAALDKALNFVVVGGCCGTNASHVVGMAHRCAH
jgi:S-methylmethionine-dependent homocysteine/selenocysteine methylase